MKRYKLWGNTNAHVEQAIDGSWVRFEDVRAFLLESKRKHYVCEDCWYSCPKSGECCNEFRKQDECDCGADEWNAKVDAALSTST